MAPDKSKDNGVAAAAATVTCSGSTSNHRGLDSDDDDDMPITKRTGASKLAMETTKVEEQTSNGSNKLAESETEPAEPSKGSSKVAPKVAVSKPPTRASAKRPIKSETPAAKRLKMDPGKKVKAEANEDDDDDDDGCSSVRKLIEASRKPGVGDASSSKKVDPPKRTASKPVAKSVKKEPSSAKGPSNGKKRGAEAAAVAAAKRAKIEKEKEKEIGDDEDEDDDGDGDEEEDDGDDDDDDEGSESSRKVVKKETKKAMAKRGKERWTTFEHNGVIFPPMYQPHGIKMLYNGKPVDLTPEQEEVATFYAVMKDSDYAKLETFNKNFWGDWKKLLGPKHTIKKLELCDFTPIFDYFQDEKERKKKMSAAEKKQLKEEKTKAEEKYAWAVVDGVKEKVGNFRVEPPGLFRGRGKHPKMGKVKRRIFPEDIVINIGKEALVPVCPMPGHKWKEIRHDNALYSLAYWNDSINEKDYKYIALHPSSSVKALNDMKKYEKARKLKDYIDKIRKTYTRDFTSPDPMKRQIAVATYLIDRLALRAGNEKDEDEADTVGCCSLKVEHVKLLDSRKIEFDFLGKDSIRYLNEVAVEEKVFKAISDFKKEPSGDSNVLGDIENLRFKSATEVPKIRHGMFQRAIARIQVLGAAILHTENRSGRRSRGGSRQTPHFRYLYEPSQTSSLQKQRCDQREARLRDNSRGRF